MLASGAGGARKSIRREHRESVMSFSMCIAYLTPPRAQVTLRASPSLPVLPAGQRKEAVVGVNTTPFSHVCLYCFPLLSVTATFSDVHVVCSVF